LDGTSWLRSDQDAFPNLVSRGQLGVWFRRQVILADRYIVDFLAPSVRLVVEVDGACHEKRRRADARRDERLRRMGYCVVRGEARVVLDDVRRAVETIMEALARRI
jgi:very-short-patch-repair endonuclease